MDTDTLLYWLRRCRDKDWIDPDVKGMDKIHGRNGLNEMIKELEDEQKDEQP